MATPKTQMRLTEEDLANARTAIATGIAKDMTDAVRQGLAMLAATVPDAHRVRPVPVKLVDCRLCGRSTRNECRVCDRHNVPTNTGLVRHSGAAHRLATCPLRKARKYR